VIEEGVEDVVRGGVRGEVGAGERGGHGGIVAGEAFGAKAQRVWRGAKFLDESKR
jgi:hypothetical protein